MVRNAPSFAFRIVANANLGSGCKLKSTGPIGTKRLHVYVKYQFTWLARVPHSSRGKQVESFRLAIAEVTHVDI